ncbi:hypothetical protein SLS64_000242 [Diaporthe eres]|uniref:Uncharacterized protein n=1 Tax=Diaporthe eres TaxID=83184 RepID=A0ABR1PF00_DIAER
MYRCEYPFSYFKIRESARALPTAASRGAFLDLYYEKQVMIVTGDTGSGKTTQIPQYVYELTTLYFPL